MKNKVWAVIPAMNEALKIGRVLEKTKTHVEHIVVVDDGSTDKTYQVATSKGVIVLQHSVNLGKGAALRTGCDLAVRKGAKKIVVLDSDGQHNPDEIPLFIEELKTHDIVFGKRHFNKKMPFMMKFGNRTINLVTRFLYGLNLSDTQSGFRAFTSSAYKKVRWNARDYSMESEMIANAGKNGLKYKEIEIETIYSDSYKGTTVLDGIRIVLRMIWWRLTK